MTWPGGWGILELVKEGFKKPSVCHINVCLMNESMNESMNK